MEEIEIALYFSGGFLLGALFMYFLWNSFFEGYVETKNKHIKEYEKALKVYKNYNDFLKNTK